MAAPGFFSMHLKRMIPRRRKESEPVALTALLMLAVGLPSIYALIPFATPEGVVFSFVQAAQDGDLAALDDMAQNPFVSSRAEVFGNEKFREVQAVFQRAERLGQNAIGSYFAAAEERADEKYRELQKRVPELGHEKYLALPIQQRLDLTKDRQKFESFKWQNGLDALPSEDAQLIENIERFRAGADREGFVRRNLWAFFPEEGKKLVKTPEGLASVDSQARRKMEIAVGIENLAPSDKAKIEGIGSEELGNEESFVAAHGIVLARQYLVSITPTLQSVECVAPRIAELGGLFVGNIVVCSSKMHLREDTSQVSFSLERSGHTWKVIGPIPFDW